MPVTARARARSGNGGRRAAVEEALRDLRAASDRRAPPPEGRLGPTDYPVARLREALVLLGPAFADFGRYLSSRPDLLPRRHCAELALIADAGAPADPRVVAAELERGLRGPVSRHFLEFDFVPERVTIWTERHHARIASGFAALVTVVRPGAEEWIAEDVPLLPLLTGCVPIDAHSLAAAIDDYTHTLRARLDLAAQATTLTALAGDVSEGAGFHAPVCYRDLCTATVLTIERPEGPDIAGLSDAGVLRDGHRVDLARRLAAAWLRQAMAGRVVPFDFTPHDIVLRDQEILLLSGAYEPQCARQRDRFSQYMSAVAADEPDAAASWILEAVDGDGVAAVREETLKRRFRQAVPFRDGEWSGDERFAEFVIVQWRAAAASGWQLSPYHIHMYRGVAAIAAMTHALAPEDDAMLVALQDARLLLGASDAARLLGPPALASRFESALREMVTLPQKLDEVLTMAAEGRLRVRLQVPESAERRAVTHQTVQLVAALVLLIAIVSPVHQAAPAYGPMVERLGSLVLLAVGAWLLVAAAKV